MTVDGISIPVYTARSVHGGDYAFATFDFTGVVKVAVTAGNRNRAEPGGHPAQVGSDCRARPRATP